MPLKRPEWLEQALKTENARGNTQQMTVVPGLLGGARRTTYTGAGADGRVQTDNPVMVDQTAFHEDELIIPSASVRKMGGPNRAMMKIRQMEMKKANAKGYELGGVVDPATSKAQMLEQRRVEEAGATTTPPASPDNPTGYVRENQEIPPPTIAGPTGAKAQMLDQRAVEEAGATVIPAPVTGPTGAKAQMLEQRAAEEAGATVIPPPSVTAPTGAKAAMLATRRAEESAPPAAGTLTPEQISTRNALATKYGRNLTAAEEQKLVNSSATDLEQWLITEGLKKPAGQEGEAAGGADQNITDAMNLMKGFATGTSDVFQRQANMAFQNLDARLQTSLISTAMRIASMPNLTDGARRTMMAEEIRNGGIAQSNLAGALADQVMQTAMQATGQLYSMATGDRAFRVGQQTAAMEEALAAGDIDGYAKMAKALYGIDVDTTALKGTQSLKSIAEGNEFIYTAIAADATTNMASNGIRTSLQKIWDAQHPGQPMDETWATDTLNHMKQTASESWQYMQGIDADAALGLFGGDQSRVDKFEFGQYKGIEAVQHAMYGFLTGGAFKLDDQGYMDFNEGNAMYQEMCKTFGWTAPASVTKTVNNADGSVTTTYSDGSTKTTKDGAVTSSTPAVATGKPAGFNPNQAATTTTGIAGQVSGIATTAPIGSTGLSRTTDGMIVDATLKPGEEGYNVLSDKGYKLSYISGNIAKDVQNGEIYRLDEEGTPLKYNSDDFLDDVQQGLDSAGIVERMGWLFKNDDPLNKDVYESFVTANPPTVPYGGTLEKPVVLGMNDVSKTGAELTGAATAYSWSDLATLETNVKNSSMTSGQKINRYIIINQARLNIAKAEADRLKASAVAQGLSGDALDSYETYLDGRYSITSLTNGIADLRAKL